MAYRGSPERHREYQRLHGHQFYVAARERRLAYQRTYREAHREEIRAYRATHRARALVAANYANRAARRAGTSAVITAADVLAVWGAEPSCHYCGGDGIGLDHVIPLSRGGANDPSNLARCCPACNTSKKDQMPEEWRAAKG